MLQSISPDIKTCQIRTPTELSSSIDGIILPGGESTAIGLIGRDNGMWEALKKFIIADKKPCWGTCAGMILLAEKVVGASAVIIGGQSLIGGMDVLVCRNYFGSQVSSFELMIDAPPASADVSEKEPEKEEPTPFPGVFIRAPAILAAGEGVEVLSKVVSVPCRQANTVLNELDEKMRKGEVVTVMGVVDTDEKDNWRNDEVKRKRRKVQEGRDDSHVEEKKGETPAYPADDSSSSPPLILPGATGVGGAREVICAARKGNILCTAFHPEISGDDRWHRYFVYEVVGKGGVGGK